MSETIPSEWFVDNELIFCAIKSYFTHLDKISKSPDLKTDFVSNVSEDVMENYKDNVTMFKSTF